MRFTLRQGLFGAVCSALLLSACQPATEHSEPAKVVTSYELVNTTEGQVKGLMSERLIAYKGIPYAAPPVGELRWRAPQPAPKHEQVLLADQYGNRCYQRPSNPAFAQKPEAFTQPESEDCLYLNIYRPDTTEDKLAVMVWIPGGGLVSGSGSRPVNFGGNLAKKNVVVVAFNYRLGSFGFFAHPDLSVENLDNGQLFNYGLMDQIAALEWVKANIAAFGGDPENVTIFGESAGGGSVDMLVASQADKGLFHRAITQSGYGRGRLPRVSSIAEENDKVVENIGVKLAETLGKSKATIAELRSVAPEEIVKATDFSSFIDFAVDGKLIKQDMMLSMHAGYQAKVPMIIGANDFEFGMAPPAVQRNIMANYFSDEIMEALIPYYGSETLRDTLLYSEYAFHAQNREFALAHEATGNPTYVYRFGMPAMGLKNIETNFGTVYGAPHAADMPYTFGNFTGDHGEPTEPSNDQLEVSDLMMTYWSNFAKTGNPNGDKGSEWPAYQGKHIMRFIPQNSGAVVDSWAERLDKINSFIKPGQY